jgi:hypothetical protein
MDSEKKQKMADNGYQYDEDLLCFVNREKGKIFATAWIEEKNINTAPAGHLEAVPQSGPAPRGNAQCAVCQVRQHSMKKREQKQPDPFFQAVNG